MIVKNSQLELAFEETKKTIIKNQDTTLDLFELFKIKLKEILEDKKGC